MTLPSQLFTKKIVFQQNLKNVYILTLCFDFVRKKFIESLSIKYLYINEIPVLSGQSQPLVTQELIHVILVLFVLTS